MYIVPNPPGTIGNGFVITCPADVLVTASLAPVDNSTSAKFVGEIAELNCVATLTSSSIGDISDTDLKHINGLLVAALKIGILPQVNPLLKAGIPLPTVGKVRIPAMLRKLIPP